MEINIIAFVITTSIAVISTIIAFSGWIKNNAFQRTKFVHEILSKFQHEDDLVKAFYLISSSRKGIFRKDNREKVDKLLMWLSYVCYLKGTGRIDDSEFCFIQSSLHRVLKHDAVKKYLQLTDKDSHKIGARCAFHYLITYGITHAIFCENEFHSQP